MTTATHPMFDIGEQARDEQRLDDAERAFRAVLADEPEHFGALYNLGKILWERREPDAAIPLLEEAARHVPRQARLELTLAEILEQLGRYELSEQLCRHLLEHNPDRADAHLLLGNLLARKGQHNAAAQSWGEALRHQPGHPQASTELASLLLGIHEPGKALRVLAAARERHPELPALKLQQAAALTETEDYDQALQLLEEIPEDAPVYASALARRAELHLAMGNPETGLEVLADAPRASTAALALAEARVRAELEEPGEAANRLRELLAREPRNLRAWEELCRISPEAVSNRDLKWLKQVRNNLAPSSWVRLGFAIARVARSRDALQGETRVLERANARQRELTPYPREQIEAFHQTLREAQDDSRLAPYRLTGDDGVQPVFLLGLPFSGTRLLEALLREQGWPGLGASGMLPAVWAELLGTTSALDVGTLLADSASDWPARFVQSVRQWLAVRGGISQGPVVERQWRSFQYLPLLRAAFPRARFIQLQRDPRDLLVANYRHYFERGHQFSYDLDDCAHLLGEHERLLEHWRAEGVEITDLSLETLLEQPVTALADAGLPSSAEFSAAARTQLQSWRNVQGLARRYKAWQSSLDEALARHLPEADSADRGAHHPAS